MERSERYDPEDLEHLMLERSFDELLAEERAYALRHLEDRAEYERMRALLHHVREDKRDPAAVGADPSVREHVLAAFRAHQQPQWRIWLNSVGGFLLPARPSTYWRPVLAFGTVAALILGSLTLWKGFGHDEHPVLAEVKQQEAPAPAAPTFKAAPDGAVGTGAANEEAEVIPSGPGTTVVPETAQERLMENGISAQPAQVGDTFPSPVREMQEQHVRIMSKQADASGKELAAVTSISKDELAAPAADNAEQVQGYTRAATKAVFESERGTVNADSRIAADKTAYSEEDLLGLLRAAW